MPRARVARAHLLVAVAKGRAEIKAQEIGNGGGPQELWYLERELRLHAQLEDEALRLATREDADPDLWPLLVGRWLDDLRPGVKVAVIG